ncbi:MAG: tRNA/rRNA methyltransferase [Candidatus Magasanikbacteria bacterium GW2011_GWA2_45_39]|uniref:tRNA/rRNA methyltransferase n=1 Tax=Candidatus Magasanikbacteria bacterium GW2011_GWA2_45_39 TaxID=1619041 RepID=A0A0G1QHY6_9BACT|nr:MAG: tRNA/rRNA methyltransferase [Candidatus Magasanikbacteria bacterium GW2011_GWA2_45_39]
MILPNIRSRFNVGSIFRTADAVGVRKIFLTGYTPRPPHSKIDKVALGATESVPWAYFRQTAPLIKKLKAEGVQIIALEKTRGSVSLYKIIPKFPCALIVGNEVEGVTARVRKFADAVVHLPMRGVKESLNVSVAFGAAAYVIRSK